MAPEPHFRATRERSQHLPGTVILVLSVATLAALASMPGQEKKYPKPRPPQADVVSGNKTFLQLCASCHGKAGKGDGPAAFVMKTSPPDLTTLAKRHEGKYPAGYVSALLKFGRSLASHGSEEMPVWGSRFRNLDPVHDPTGQLHIDDIVAYIQSLQMK